MLERVATDLLWPSIASVQIVDLTNDNDEAIFELVGALERLPDALSLPDPLPEPPPVPVSYLTSLGEQLQKPSLTQDEQFLLLPKFREGLQRPREREAVLQLMQRMRSRNDLFAGPAKELEDLFDEARRGQQQTTPMAAPPPTPQPIRQPAPTSGSGTKVLVGLLVGLAVAGVIAFLAILGSSTTTTSAVHSTSLTTTPDPSPAATPAVGDACLVGSWVSTNNSGTAQADNTSLQLSGGAGILLTITSEGRVTADLSSSDPIQFTDDSGTLRVESQLDGTLAFDLRVSSDGSVKEAMVSNRATVIRTVDGVEGTPEPVTPSADTSYSCAGSTMSFNAADGATTYAKR
jgi:hypothetical protein